MSREIVVAAALQLIDEGGLDSFSLRTLAQKLGVYPTAVYWYVPNRNDLMASVVALILDSVPNQKRRRTWQHSLRDLFHGFRAAVAAHPNAAPLIGAAVVSNNSMSFAFVEHVLGILARATLSGASLVAGYNAVIAALVGFVTQEFASMPKEDSSAWQMSVQQRLLEIDRDAHPILAANLKLLSNQAFYYAVAERHRRSARTELHSLHRRDREWDRSDGRAARLIVTHVAQATSPAD